MAVVPTRIAASLPGRNGCTVVVVDAQRRTKVVRGSFADDGASGSARGGHSDQSGSSEQVGEAHSK